MTNLERAARELIDDYTRLHPEWREGHRIGDHSVAIRALESALKELEAPAVPTAVDLTLARPGDVCRLRNGCQILFEGDNLGIDGDRNTELPFLAGGESYKANGAYLDCETIAGSDIIAVCRDGRLICGVDITSTGDSE